MKDDIFYRKTEITTIGIRIEDNSTTLLELKHMSNRIECIEFLILLNLEIYKRKRIFSKKYKYPRMILRQLLKIKCSYPLKTLDIKF